MKQKLLLVFSVVLAVPGVAAVYYWKQNFGQSEDPMQKILLTCACLSVLAVSVASAVAAVKKALVLIVEERRALSRLKRKRITYRKMRILYGFGKPLNEYCDITHDREKESLEISLPGNLYMLNMNNVEEVRYHENIYNVLLAQGKEIFGGDAEVMRPILFEEKRIREDKTSIRPTDGMIVTYRQGEQGTLIHLVFDNDVFFAITQCSGEISSFIPSRMSGIIVM